MRFPRPSSPLCAALALAWGLPATAAEISDAKASSITGTPGISHVSKAKKSRFGDYVDHDYSAGGESLFTLRPGTPELYQTWKQTAGPNTEPVTGLGTDAFAYKLGPMISVCARSAGSAACVTTSPLANKPLSKDVVVKLVQAAL